MPELQHLALFVVAGWLLNLTPGPDVLYIVTNSLRSGARAGLVAGLGITAGCFVHVFAAALGVGVLLATSAMAFTALKYIGAAYLLWMGAKILLTNAHPPTHLSVSDAGGSPATLWSVFAGGFLTNVLNPKVALFFLAFVPQFIAPDSENKAVAFVLLGVLFNINSIPVNSGWALAAARMARSNSVQRAMHWLDRIAACMFIGFGVKLALTDNPTR
ncbi:LysE family translocator [Caenimonas sp. SL110]|uniref:LysE family translocator n=1 Tax=Caenimonas sp. SL110 TaxID=1450524 RepID=UPI000653F7BE|nr:LysE family translocator [Caenimonas sp. SL110]